MELYNILVSNIDELVYEAFTINDYNQNDYNYSVKNVQYPKILFTLYPNIELPEDFVPFGYKYDGIEFKKVEEVAE